MKLFQNPPQNVEQFSKNYGVWKSAKNTIIAGFIVGILSEFAILNALIDSHIGQFFNNYPKFLPAILAGFFAFFLASERVNFGRQVAKFYNDRETRSIGTDAMVLTIIACIAVYGISIFLSYIGTQAAIQTAILPPESVKTESIDQATISRKNAILTEYKADSNATAKQWQERINAETAKYNNKIKSLQGKVNAGKNWLLPELQRLKNEKSEFIATLKAEKSAALLRLLDSKKQGMSAETDRTSTELAQVLKNGEETQKKYNALKSRAEKYLPTFVIVSIILMFFGLLLDERFKAKAGIKEVVLPGEYDNLPSLFSEYKESLKVFFQSILRRIATFIRKQAKPAAMVVDSSASELVRIELEKYKERVMQYGSEPHTPTPHNQNIGFKQYPPDPQNTVITGNNTQKQAILELLNTYKIERQRLQVYLKRQKEQTGNPETLKKNIAFHAANMQTAESSINKAGYKIFVNKGSRKIELKPL